MRAPGKPFRCIVNKPPVTATANLRTHVLDVVEAAGSAGITMGALIDRIDAEGFDVATAELEIWSLLSARELTPVGFVCRSLRSRHTIRRSYEFLLIRWSVEQDRQLDLVGVP